LEKRNRRDAEAQRKHQLWRGNRRGAETQRIDPLLEKRDRRDGETQRIDPLLEKRNRRGAEKTSIVEKEPQRRREHIRSWKKVTAETERKKRITASLILVVPIANPRRLSVSAVFLPFCLFAYFPFAIQCSASAGANMKNTRTIRM